jgi:microcystin degradation protein MlrC
MGPFRVISAEILHETNTFNRKSTDLSSFSARCLYYGNNAIDERAQSNTEIAGFVQCAAQFGWSLIHTVSAHAEPSGMVTNATFEHLVGVVVAGITEAVKTGPIDAVLLALHGAMVVESDEDGDGAILERIRNVLGPSVIIAATLDLHANVTRRMCRNADILVSYKTYPHIDMRATAVHACTLVQRSLLNEVEPVVFFVSVPMMEESNSGRTDVGPMVGRMSRIAEYERQPRGALAVSINAGFPTDISELGPTVVVVYNKRESDEELRAHKEFALSLAEDIWINRKDVINRFPLIIPLYFLSLRLCFILDYYRRFCHLHFCCSGLCPSRRPLSWLPSTTAPAAGRWSSLITRTTQVGRCICNRMECTPLLSSCRWWCLRRLY